MLGSGHCSQKDTCLYKPRRSSPHSEQKIPRRKKQRRSSLPIHMKIKRSTHLKQRKKRCSFSHKIVAQHYNMNRRDEIHRTPFNHEPPRRVLRPLCVLYGLSRNGQKLHGLYRRQKAFFFRLFLATELSQSIIIKRFYHLFVKHDNWRMKKMYV